MDVPVFVYERHRQGDVGVESQRRPKVGCQPNTAELVLDRQENCSYVISDLIGLLLSKAR